MTYCQGRGHIQIIIIEDAYGQDVLPRLSVYTDHHGDTYGQDILPRPRVYTDHHGDTVKTYCKGQGCIQIIMETRGQDILLRQTVYTDHHGDT